MKTSIVKIGNSRGVRIPKQLLDETGLAGEVTITAKGSTIEICAIKKDVVDEGVLLSHSALAKEWNSPEEDQAWASLQ